MSMKCCDDRPATAEGGGKSWFIMSSCHEDLYILYLPGHGSSISHKLDRFYQRVEQRPRVSEIGWAT
jgi:hypothetical protein